MRFTVRCRVRWSSTRDWRRWHRPVQPCRVAFTARRRVSRCPMIRPRWRRRRLRGLHGHKARRIYRRRRRRRRWGRSSELPLQPELVLRRAQHRTTLPSGLKLGVTVCVTAVTCERPAAIHSVPLSVNCRFTVLPHGLPRPYSAILVLGICSTRPRAAAAVRSAWRSSRTRPGSRRRAGSTCAASRRACRR